MVSLVPGVLGGSTAVDVVSFAMVSHCFVIKLEEENVVVFDSVKLNGLHIAVEWDSYSIASAISTIFRKGFFLFN